MAKRAKRTAAARDAFDGKDNLDGRRGLRRSSRQGHGEVRRDLEIAMNLGVDPRHADQMVRGVAHPPNGTGKTVRVAVFAAATRPTKRRPPGRTSSAPRTHGAIQGGKIDFDRSIATPDMVPMVGRLGKILGPRNLMRNPKVGTVTLDVAQAVRAAKGGQVQFKVEKAGVVHAGVGKASFEAEKACGERPGLRPARTGRGPAGAKGAYLKKISISSTMGPGVTVDIANAVADWTGDRRRRAPGP